MKDIYLHPTVRLLAAAIGEPGPAREQARPGPAGGQAPGSWRVPGAPPEVAPAARGALAYALCGTLQLLAFAAYVAGFSLAVNAGAAWAVAGSGVLGIYARLWSSAGEGCWPWGSCRCWPSDSSSAAGSRGASGRGAWPTSGSGSSRR
jgi:hypothetical protein